MENLHEILSSLPEMSYDVMDVIRLKFAERLPYVIALSLGESAIESKTIQNANYL